MDRTILQRLRSFPCLGTKWILTSWLFTASAATLSSGLLAGEECNDYPSYASGTISKFIKFANADSNPSLANGMSLEFSVTTPYSNSSYDLVSAMDTGSTGLCISASSLGLEGSDFEELNQAGYEYLDSSCRLWEGYWISATVSFPNTGVVSGIPILAVTNSSICRSAHFSNGHCPDEYKEELQYWPTGIKYMGVGFGRWSIEQPLALPDKVPFTNIISVDGGTPADMYPGYIITSNGIHIGLTSENTQPFAKTKLKLRPGSSSDTDWQMVQMALTVNDLPWSMGSALFDTGITQSYITLDSQIQQQLPTEHYKNPRTKKTVKIIAPGNRIRMLIGDDPLGAPIAYYNVVANDTSNPMNPEEGEFLPVLLGSEPYLNTGRFFYNGFDVMYDAKCGWLGLRWKGDQHDPNGGTEFDSIDQKGHVLAHVVEPAQHIVSGVKV